MTGEATVVEVAQGRTLFALLGGSEERLAAAKDCFAGMTRGEWLRLIPVQTEPVALTGDLIPMLVTFDDITKPETVRQVDPADLSATLGPGVSLRAVTLEITDEPVRVGRGEGVLEWLGPNPEPALGPATGGITNIPFYRKVHMGDFIRRAQ